MSPVNLTNIDIAIEQFRKRRCFVDENGQIIEAPIEEILNQYHWPTVDLTDEEFEIVLDRLCKEC